MTAAHTAPHARTPDRNGRSAATSHFSVDAAPDPSPAVDKAAARRLLIVSDDDDTRAKLLQHFMRNKQVTPMASRSDTALAFLSHSVEYDLVLLDLTGRPRNYQVLSRAQSELPNAAILVVIDQGCLKEQQGGRTLGADDFVVKPFCLQELCVRATALLGGDAPSPQNARSTCTIRNLTLDFRTRSCYRDDQCVALTAREFDVLDYLFKHRGRAVSREVLIESVWGTRHAISPRTIDRHITSIRRKIEEDASMPVHLQTVYGEGYRFMAG